MVSPRSRSEPESAETRAVREVFEEDEDALKALAAQAGPPQDSERLSETDEDEAWAFADPSVDVEALAQQLGMQGLSPDQLAGLKVLQVHPDWAPLFQQPSSSPEEASQRAQLARYPYRWALLQQTPDATEQVQKAERLARRYQQRMARGRAVSLAAPALPTSAGAPPLPATIPAMPPPRPAAPTSFTSEAGPAGPAVPPPLPTLGG